MNFQRREESLELGGQTVTLRELSAGEFEAVMSLPEDEQGYALVFTSLVDQPESPQAIRDWPNTIVNTISEAVMALNGFTDQGN
tara:strand:+ start:1463 stop:1714 length:252 start_codon:yes stop_codon:yes gene_type:complete